MRWKLFIEFMLSTCELMHQVTQIYVLQRKYQCKTKSHICTTTP